MENKSKRIEKEILAMGKMWFFLKEAIVSFFSDEKVKGKYKQAGAVFGDATSYICLGECAGVEQLLNTWAFWEKEVAKRGFRTMSLDQFIDYGDWGKPLNGFGEMREKDEKPIYHAEIYREKYLGKVKPLINIQALEEGGMQTGKYITPSTED